ncbi:dna repair and transcription factor [Curvularia clavata]|uniref:Dna repair and transcription factor n=1 Tax=Curvularia clavata TaxID=95742 RepID=A0A9Q8Z8Y5_CURCL|nr:dna repair and transcription factor [Curvularia clavata]
MAYTTDAARWRALTVRDANANGHFIYSVKSTNIYCRPTCPGRLARRANVGFYATWREAEAAGFRACKRCKPNSTVVEDPQEHAVKKACGLIEEALKSEDAGASRLQNLAKKVGLTPRYFHKIFKDKTGLTPKEYATKRAMENRRAATASVSTTATETSTHSRSWDDLNFNDLIDFGSDSNVHLLNTDGLAILQDQSLTTDANLELGMDGLFQPWSEGYEPAQVVSQIFGHDNHISKSLGATSVDMSYYEKTVPYVSTLEQDAAALLSCDNLASLLQG